MTTVNFLSLLWGISLVIISFALLARPHNAKVLLKTTEDEKTMTLLGVIAVIAGVALIMFYNMWDTSWHSLVSLIGWIVLAKGIVILFAPKMLKKVSSLEENINNWMPFALLASTLIGCFLVYAGISF